MMWLASMICQWSLAASNMLVWPVYQTIEADQRGSILWLENRGKNDVTLQIRILRWSQKDQQDVYADQQDVLASPPFMVVPAGQRQIVRLLRQIDMSPQQESAYRIVIDEIPAQQTKPTQPMIGLNLQMRYVLPLFMQGDGIWTAERTDKKRDLKTAAQPQLSWSIETKGNQHFLVLVNQGKVHARISNVFFGDNNNIGQATAVVRIGLLGYVLPEKKMAWTLAKDQKIPSDKKLFIQLEDNRPAIEIPKN
ncbi:fimbria/pilus periplasmic chaperone [Acinetobacter sp. ME22]|uniref:fimbrial biogenesis chaperone n=1 Tax=Acinetobacter sp. ME22 TaxID=2904802 RepID=UPI001EDC6AA1|nr:fimbria/pilus periplasmic chaperone [Acinetobacter sp. ME22]MCG2574447.1 fimbria/pilus periplasmic chaperone [Acinetobacter sp. ME22]